MRTHFAAALACAALLTSADRIAAQDATKDTAAWTTGATQLRGGAMSLGLRRVNADLDRNGRPTFPNDIPAFGIAAYARRGRLLLGASAEGSLPRRASQSGFRTRLSAGTATLDAGAVLVDARRTFVRSTLSLGLRRTSLHFEREGDFTYSDGLADPARALDLASRTAIVQIGVGAERRFDARRVGRFAIAVEGGITRPFGAVSTAAGENRVQQTPGQDGSGYLRLAFAKPLARRARVLDTVGAALLSALAR